MESLLRYSMHYGIDRASVAPLVPPMLFRATCIYGLYFLLHLDFPDYTLQGETGTIFYTFSPNVSQQCTTIQTLEDNFPEPPETLSLRMVLLSEEIDLNLTPATTNVTIMNRK